MPVYVVVPEKLPGQKRYDDEDAEEEEERIFCIFGIILTAHYFIIFDPFFFSLLPNGTPKSSPNRYS